MSKVLITLGLPCNDKTVFLEKYQEYISEKNIIYLEIDKYSKDFTLTSKCNIKDNINQNKNIICDAFFLNDEDIIKLINITAPLQDNEYEIHYWEADKEVCTWNFKHRRRDRLSMSGIDNDDIESPNIELIKEKTKQNNIIIVKHDIIKMQPYNMFIDKYNIHINDQDEMMSGAWSLGGTWKNCWGDSGIARADSQPSFFENFDDLIKQVCPSISFFDYKKLHNKCVEIRTYFEGDYYGGNIENAYFVCNVSKLYNSLIEMELLDELIFKLFNDL